MRLTGTLAGITCSSCAPAPPTPSIGWSGSRSRWWWCPRWPATAFGLIVARRYWALRIASGTATAVASVVAACGLAQYPWLFPQTLSLQAGSAPPASLLAELAVVGLAALL